MIGIIYAAWAVIGFVWFAGALGNKRTARDESAGSLALHVSLTALGFVLLFDQEAGSTPPVFAATGLALTIAGLAFSIWARVILGRNWSATVTLKENHELVRRGPYRFVRHPIYTGALAAMLGTAIVFGGWPGFAGFGIALFAWKLKSLTEERFLVEEFGESYVRYRREVKALIPGFLQVRNAFASLLCSPGGSAL